MLRVVRGSLKTRVQANAGFCRRFRPARATDLVNTERPGRNLPPCSQVKWTSGTLPDSSVFALLCAGQHGFAAGL